MLMVCQAWHGHDGWGSSWERMCRARRDSGTSERGTGVEAGAGTEVPTLLWGPPEWQQQAGGGWAGMRHRE